MIIKEEKSSITTIGDIKQNKVSIDPKNLDFITTLLSSNLYSNPEQSFMREIVSNAWDSHVEAGNTDKAVIITIDNNWVSIRDYGTGLSPERFKEIYLNIGSSTKRDTNTQIGGFGIGRMSALACANVCHITSYYNGTMYKYLMVKDGNNINIDLLVASPTDQPNGLDVSINVSTVNDYIKALEYLVYFPNVYVQGNSYRITEFNKAKIKRFKSFAVSSINNYHKILLGNVLYPLSTGILSQQSKSLLDSFLSSCNIALVFNIGELTVTPNREAILYTQDTISKIESKIQEAVDEIVGIIAEPINKDYPDLLEYVRLHTNNIIRYNFFDNTFSSINISESCAFSVPKVISYLKSNNSFKITYQGKELTTEETEALCSAYKTISHYSLPNAIGVIGLDRVYTSKIPYRYVARSILKSAKAIVMLPTKIAIRNNIRDFLLTKNYTNICYKVSLDKFKSLIQTQTYKFSGFTKEDEMLLEAFYNKMLKESTDFDPETDSEFLAYKESIKNNKTTNKGKRSNTPITMRYRIDASNHHWYTKIGTDIKDLERTFNTFRNKNTACIVTNTRSEYLNVLDSIAEFKQWHILTVPKEYVNSINIKGKITEEEILNFNNPIIKTAYTFNKCATYGVELSKLRVFNRFLTSIQIDKINYYNLLKNRLYNYSEFRAFINKFPLDREVDETVVDTIKEVEGLELKLKDHYNALYNAGVDVYSRACVYFTMKSKVLKVPYKEYKDMKKSYLFK